MKNRIIWGINDSSHDAALSVIADGQIKFAAHAERYDKIKNSFSIPPELIEDALAYGEPSLIAYFEKRILKKLRRAMFGGINGEYKNLYKNKFDNLCSVKENQHSHHLSHAAAGYYTSPFRDATIVVIDAIGEFETATIWEASGISISKKFSLRYPVSFGLFYSAFTHLLGLEPGKEEYILMGMAAFGDKNRFISKVNSYFPKFNYQQLNMHSGIHDWGNEISSDQDRYDIAASVQAVYEERLSEIMQFAQSISRSRNLVFMGGCALNCRANASIGNMWENIWIMPNPGDAGSSLGAALVSLGSHVEWSGPYTGRNISGDYPVAKIISELTENGIVAVASGRAEFGPRALGNRSILADPRTHGNKDSVNKIKKREKFRPFAPVVMAEHASEWFDLDSESPYMQFAVKCKNPSAIPAVVHVDGTSRVQTVTKAQHPGLYAVLKKWKEISGVPILLNTSLNIKNQPLLNDEFDAVIWSRGNSQIKILGGESQIFY
jgi:carbamoyltransferase